MFPRGLGHRVRSQLQVQEGDGKPGEVLTLCSRLPAPLELRQFDHGESTRSYLVKFGGRLLVLKKEEEPPDGPSGPSVPREYR